MKHKIHWFATLLTICAGSASFAQQNDSDIDFDADLLPTTEQLPSVTEIELVPVPTREQLDAIEKIEKQNIDTVQVAEISNRELSANYSARIISALRGQPTNREILPKSFVQTQSL